MMIDVEGLKEGDELHTPIRLGDRWTVKSIRLTRLRKTATTLSFETVLGNRETINLARSDILVGYYPSKQECESVVHRLNTEVVSLPTKPFRQTVTD